MTTESSNTRRTVAEFIANHWVSWMIELLILGIVAYFTISETRKTAEQTREMLAKYDAAISQYAKDKTQILDNAAHQAIEAAKEKAGGVKLEDVKGLIKSHQSED